MTTNVPGRRSTNRSDETVRVEPTPTPVTNPSGVNGVAVYDRGSDQPVSSTMNSSAVNPSVSTLEDSTLSTSPSTSSSTGTMIAWIIGIVILILVVYFLWQMYF